MRWPLRAAILAVVATLHPACGGGPFKGFFVPFPNTTANGVLRGSQVVPASGSAASGTATVVADGLGKFVTYSIDATGLGTVTAIEIRSGGPGTNGAVLFTIPLGAFPLSGTLTAPSASGPFPPSMSQACGAIAQGNTYLLISTLAKPQGELRAHLGKSILASAVLSGSQEVPPLGLPAAGTATVDLDDAQATWTVTLNVSGLSSAVTTAQIFDGPPGNAGTTALFTVSPGAFTGSVTKALTSTDFTGSAGVATFADAVNALLSGGLFVQVSTVNHDTTGTPKGEVRGQIGPVQLSAPTMSGADFFNPVATAATGAATVTLDATQSQFLVQLTHTVTSPTSVTLNAQLPSFNGPMVFDVGVIAGAATSPVTATMSPGMLTAAASRGINTYTDFVTALLVGQIYIQVASTGFNQGEIRGQLLP